MGRKHHILQKPEKINTVVGDEQNLPSTIQSGISAQQLKLPTFEENGFNDSLDIFIEQ